MACPSLPRLVESGQEIRALIRDAQRANKKVGFVPTMGALHAGHLSLIEAACGECEFRAVSIFVNPTQFGPREDFAKYPRTLETDLRMMSRLPVDAIFIPSAEEMYGPNFDTYVMPGKVAEPWEGAIRPTHFRGVATVVLKLFNLVPADVAYFGQKDYQQSLVIRRLVADLNLPVQIRVCPIVREPDGLAMSSRNVYLSPAQRQQALALSQSLRKAAELVQAGERKSNALISAMQAVLSSAGELQVEYVTLADPETLASVEQIAGPTVALVAARVGTTRLIDNMILELS